MSSIILNEGIDSGKVIHRASYELDFDARLIDYVYDPLLRANHLIDTLKKLQLSNTVAKKQPELDARTFYIIHPVLKHIAIQKGLKKCGLA